MTARPWGTTGRVTLTRHDDEGAPGYHVDHDVNVDGLFVGATCDWGVRILAEVNGVVSDTTFPSLDAAVMWVLRRADAEVWRQERGPVWRVESDSLWSPDGWVPGWFATRPDRTAGIGWPNWADALACAHNNAREAVS